MTGVSGNWPTPIKKSARGRYYYLRFDGDSALIAELERRLRLDDKVLRYQSVNITDLPERAAVPEKKVETPEVEEVEEVLKKHLPLKKLPNNFLKEIYS